jgi:hypothetical protein
MGDYARMAELLMPGLGVRLELDYLLAIASREPATSTRGRKLCVESARRNT